MIVDGVMYGRSCVRCGERGGVLEAHDGLICRGCDDGSGGGSAELGELVGLPVGEPLDFEESAPCR